MIPLDSGAIRKKALTACRRAQTAFLKSQATLTRWENEEQPAAEAWYATTAGELLTTLRELSAKLERERSLLFMMLQHEDRTGRSPADCHDDVMRRLETPPTEQEWEEWAESKHARAQAEDDLDDEESVIRDFFEELLGFSPGDDGEEDEPWSRAPGAGRTPAEPSPGRQERDQEIRGLYRRLCRELHPDGGGDFDERRRDLFHQVQEAYEARDLARLNHLASVVENGGEVPEKASKVDTILRAIRRFQESAHFVKQRIREARLSDLWGFFSWTDQKREQKARQLWQSLAHEVHFLRRDQAQVERELQRFKLASQRRKEKELKRAEARAARSRAPAR